MGAWSAATPTTPTTARRPGAAGSTKRAVITPSRSRPTSPASWRTSACSSAIRPRARRSARPLRWTHTAAAWSSGGCGRAPRSLAPCGRLGGGGRAGAGGPDSGPLADLSGASAPPGAALLPEQPARPGVGAPHVGTGAPALAHPEPAAVAARRDPGRGCLAGALRPRAAGPQRASQRRRRRAPPAPRRQPRRRPAYPCVPLPGPRRRASSACSA